MKVSPKSQKTNLQRGFSLVELMVVVSIIVVLAGLTVSVAGYVNKKGQITKATTQMELLSAKIEEYRIDARFLQEENDDTGLMIYSMLYGDGVGPDGVLGTDDDTEPDGLPDEGAAKIYLSDLDPVSNPQNMIEMQPGGANIPAKLIDPWGNAWRFRADNQKLNPQFDIWSVGPDGESGTEDDIRNW